MNILPLPTHLWAWNYESILKILLLESINTIFTQTVKHRSMQENPLPPSRRSSPPTNTLLAFLPILKFPYSYLILFTNGKWQFLPLFIQNSCFYETHPNLHANYTLIPPPPTHAEISTGTSAMRSDIYKTNFCSNEPTNV